MITSMSNAQIKHIQQLMKKAKARRESGLFVVEGIKMFREAPKERIHRVYASVSFWSQRTTVPFWRKKDSGREVRRWRKWRIRYSAPFPIR